ncbi:hypothetical protein C7S16_3852 [Burkholderia thailandensis]|uniref:Uncharacterized protein n=1 Tax=Burkholderia thailandensis TaxID=57975 RepID=A0AAW9CWW3_BURTH|nr:hypothetical protein [Burkholderia thailandensis]MDW9255125.1 hypothetical protein [Burkholderia thailandensis]
MARREPSIHKIDASHLIEIRKIIRRSSYLFDSSDRNRIVSKDASGVSTRRARTAL